MKFAKLLATALVVLVVPFAMASDYRPSGGGSSGPGGDGCNPPEGTVGSMLTNANGGNCGTTATVVVSGSVATVTGKLSVDNVDVDGNTLSTTDTNGNLTLSPAGNGDVVVASDTLNFSDTAATISGTNLTISPTGTFEATGTTATLDSSGGIFLEANSGTITFKGASDAALGTITTSGWSGKTAAVDIGGVEFDSSGSIDLPGVNEVGTQNIITDATSLILKAQGAGHSVDVWSMDASVAVTAETTLDMFSKGVAELASTGGVVLDSGADIKLESDTGVINFTKASLADMGTITLDASDVAVYSGKSATTGKLHSSVDIGGVAFDGASSINLPGVNEVGTVDTAGTAAIATKVTVTASPTTNGEFFVPVYSTATGNLDTTTDTELRFNPNTHVFDAKKMKTESITTDDFLLVDSGGNATVEISNKKIILSNGAANAGTTTFTVSANGQLALGTSDSDGSEADISVTADGSMSFTSASSENITLSPGSNKVLLGNFLEVAGSGTSAKDLDFKLGQANGQFTFSNSAGTALLTIDETSTDIITAHTLFKTASKFLTSGVWNADGTEVAIQIAADGKVTFPAGLTIPNNAVGNDQLADDAVNTAELANNAVGNDQLADNAVNTAELADDAVTDAKIAAGAVDTSELDTDAVTSVKIKASAVTAVKIADGAVTAAKIAASAVETAKLANDAVTGPKIADQAIYNANINNSAAIAYSKMEGGVACGGTDDSAAVTTAIAAGSRVLLTGSVCRIKDVILASNVKISCAPGTVLKPHSGAGALFKGPTSELTLQSTFPHSWEISDCTVDLEKTHVPFIDVSSLPANTTLLTNTIRGHRGYRIANNTIKYTGDPLPGDSTASAFSYIKASCVTASPAADVAPDASDYQYGPCRIENNNILGSQTGRGRNTYCHSQDPEVEYGDTGLEISYVSLDGYQGYSPVPGAGTMIISENSIEGVESSALKTTGALYSVILADNGFETCESEEPLIYSTSSSNVIGWSQVTGNQFSAVDNDDVKATEMHFAGANNQVVGNTFQALAQPVLGKSVNFVGNYTAGNTAGMGVWLMTTPASNGIAFTTQNVLNQHSSFVGNVGTARIYVTNPQDLVIANNKMLGVDVGVEIKVDVTDGNANQNKIGRVAITGNVFSVTGDASDTYVVIDFVGTGSVDRDFHDTVITGNVIGNHGDGTADAKPSKCFGGGAALFNYKSLNITNNTLECDAIGYPDTFTSTSNSDITFCNTSSLFGSCLVFAAGELADEQAFALPTTKISSVTGSLRDVSVKYDITCTDCSGTGRNVDGNVGILTLPVPTGAPTGQELTIDAANFASGDVMLLPLGTTLDGVGNCAFCTDSGTDTQYGCALKEDTVLNLKWNTPTANKWNIVSCTGNNALTGMLTPMVETAVQSLTGTTTSNENLAANAGFIWADNTTSGNLRLASTGVNDPGVSADGKKVRIMVDPTATHHVQWLTTFLDSQIGSLFDPADAATVCATADHGSMCNFLLGCTIDPGQAIEVEWDEDNTKWKLTDCWGVR